MNETLIAKKGLLKSLLSDEDGHCLVMQATIGREKTNEDDVEISMVIPVDMYSWKKLQLNLQQAESLRVTLDSKTHLNLVVNLNISRLENNTFKVEFSVPSLFQQLNTEIVFKYKAKYIGLTVWESSAFNPFKPEAESLDEIIDLSEFNDPVGIMTGAKYEAKI